MGKHAFDDRRSSTSKISSQEPPMKACILEVKHHFSPSDQNLLGQERVSLIPLSFFRGGLSSNVFSCIVLVWLVLSCHVLSCPIFLSLHILSCLVLLSHLC